MAYWGGYYPQQQEYYPSGYDYSGYTNSYNGYADQAYNGYSGYEGYNDGYGYNNSYGGYDEGYADWGRSGGYDYSYDQAPRRDKYQAAYAYDDYQQDQYNQPAPRRERSGERSGSKPRALKEEDLRRHDYAQGDKGSRRGAGRKKAPVAPKDDFDVETHTVGTASTVSTVGTTWREIDKATGKEKKYKRSTGGMVKPPVGKRMALLVGVENQNLAVSTAMTQVANFLGKDHRYKCEQCLDDDNNRDQFFADIKSGISELIGLAKPGDAIFLYFCNYQEEGNYNLGFLLYQLARDVDKGVRVTCLFDCCYLPNKPSFEINHNQARIKTYQSAGVLSKKRLAKVIPGSGKLFKPRCDIFCFIGESAREELSTFYLPKIGRYTATFTGAFVRAFLDEDIWSVRRPPTYAALSKHLDIKLNEIIENPTLQAVQPGVFCDKAYCIDQPCYL